MSRLICLCSGIRDEQILEVLNNNENPTLELIQSETGAACNCGRCISKIEAMIEKQNAAIEVTK
ncbi:MAG: (2Fe-2S)-binding protein [Carboxylicivirga sp.]|jgi:bacterioferritin-associated ferredoxin|nr:(2Fe-2S)-binding protein [Carboxylicivirga sp.]